MGVVLDDELFLVYCSHRVLFLEVACFSDAPHEVKHTYSLNGWKVLTFLFAEVIDAVPLHLMLQPLLIEDTVECHVIRRLTFLF